MARYLIIGGGLIGVHVAKELNNKNEHDFIMQAHRIDFDYANSVTQINPEQAIQRPIYDSASLLSLIDSYDIKNIIVAAGSLHPSFKKHSGAALLNESQLLLSIQAVCSKKRIDKLIYISSLAVYGNDTESRTEQSLPRPLSIYGATKLYNEQIVKSITEYTECNALVIRPTGTVGPNPNLSGNWMSRSLNQIIKSNDAQIELDNLLLSSNEFLDVRDLSVFIVSNLEKSKQFDVVNLGPGKITSGEELLFDLKRTYNKNFIQKTNNLQTPQPKINKPLPIEKAIKEYNFSPKYNLQKTLEYIGDYYGKVPN
ncbi:NAD(P)-dependent oxidoreductase [Bacillus sp. Bos-x628]|uniref:NAD-dependent epimerase/dehydratase family protein n=1 Tax=Bacillus maqinnsis TaxID=3229854 RepID=UPI00338E1F56